MLVVSVTNAILLIVNDSFIPIVRNQFYQKLSFDDSRTNRKIKG